MWDHIRRTRVGAHDPCVAFGFSRPGILDRRDTRTTKKYDELSRVVLGSGRLSFKVYGVGKFSNISAEEVQEREFLQDNTSCRVTLGIDWMGPDDYVSKV